MRGDWYLERLGWGPAAPRELVRAFVPRYAAGDPIPEVEVFEDRFAEALPDGAFTREIPRRDPTEGKWDMSRSGSDPADKPGEMTPSPGADLAEGPDTDAFVVRAASAPERLFLSSRFRFLATTVETAGRYSFLAADVPVGGGPRPHVHQETDEWFYVLQGDPVFHVDDRTITLAEGDFVHIPMGTTHWFEVLDAPIKVLAGYSPAGPELAFL